MTEAKSITAEPTEQTDDAVTLVAEDVSREFGSVTVVEEISLQLQAGQLHAIIGPNGSGKTTLLRLLAGLLEPTDGSITHQIDDHERPIGYLPQRPSFRPGFTARETMEFYAAFVDADPAELLERVGLEEAGGRRVEALSGGMTRLLGLAQATAGDPPIVMLDEPGSGLDPGMSRRTLEFARSLADDGVSVLFSTHNLGLAGTFSDQVTMLESGSVVTTGAPTALEAEHDADDLWGVFEAVVENPTGAVEVIGGEQS